MATQIWVIIGSGNGYWLRAPAIPWTNAEESLWHSFQGNVYFNNQDINPQYVFENNTFEMTVTTCEGQWVNTMATADYPYISSALVAMILTCFPQNILALGQNGLHFTNNILKCISLIEKAQITIKFHWSVFLRVQSTICQHWLR